jgi:hypothetical protein
VVLEQQKSQLLPPALPHHPPTCTALAATHNLLCAKLLRRVAAVAGAPNNTNTNRAALTCVVSRDAGQQCCTRSRKVCCRHQPCHITSPQPRQLQSPKVARQAGFKLADSCARQFGWEVLQTYAQHSVATSADPTAGRHGCRLLRTPSAKNSDSKLCTRRHTFISHSLSQ